MAEISDSEPPFTDSLSETPHSPPPPPPPQQLQQQPAPDFDPKTMRTTKPGAKRLILTLSILFSFLLGFPFFWKSVEIYRSPLPFTDIHALSNDVTSRPLLFPSYFQSIFLTKSKPNLNPHNLRLSILSKITKLTSPNPQCAVNFTLSVTVDPAADAAIGCSRSPPDNYDYNNEPSCLYRCGAFRAVDFDFGDDEGADEGLKSVLGDNCSGFGGKVYSVVVVEDGLGGLEEGVRAVVGKYQHAWIVAAGREMGAEEMAERVAEIFVKVFLNGGREEGLIHGEFMPVGADGRIVLSFNLLNANPRDWVYDW